MPANPVFHYIDRQGALDQLVDELKTAERVALDIEGDSLYHYFEKICLIQLSFNDTNYLIDPLSDIDLKRLMKLLPTCRLYLHGGEFDLRMLRTHYRLSPPAQIFDTMLAAQILGWERLGLAALAKEIAGVTLPKTDKKSDWSARPLKETQLKYAANDTRFLFQIADVLEKELVKLGRREWLDESCRAMVKATMARREQVTPDMEWRIKGINRMTPRELAIVREVWQFRDRLAQESDRPAFKILGNQAIIDLAYEYAESGPKTFKLDARLPRNFGPDKVRALTKAIKSALSLKEEELPQPLKPRPIVPIAPEVERLREACAEIAAKHNIPAAVLAPRAALEAIARKQAVEIEQILKVSKLLKWQAELIQPAIKKLLK